MTADSTPTLRPRPLRVLVTGAGGPAAIGLIRDVVSAEVTILAADADPMAPGLYLVPASQRVIVPLGTAAGFAAALLKVCVDFGVDVLVPTCDAELEPLARFHDAFLERGVTIATSSLSALNNCLDKYTLYERCHALVPTPMTKILEDTRAELPRLPIIIKPRRGSGSRGVRLIRTVEEWMALSSDTDMISQEYLPGLEYSVDCFAVPGGRVVAAVPRERMKVDSGVAVVCRTVKDPQLQTLAVKVVEALGLEYAVNVQFRRAADGTPKLLEVNPRLAGTMRLTSLAGINLPWLTVKAAAKSAPWMFHLPPGLLPFQEHIIVRTLQEHSISSHELERLQQLSFSAGPPPLPSYGGDGLNEAAL